MNKVVEILRPYGGVVKYDEDAHIYFLIPPTLKEAMAVTKEVQEKVAIETTEEAHAICQSVADNMDLRKEVL